MDVPLLAQSHLSVITRHSDYELVRIQEIIEHKVLVDGRSELEELLGRLLAVGDEPTPKTLDLIGHSTAGSSLLTLGDWILDASNSTVTSFFRELADNDVLPRLGIHAVRLLGCQTAETTKGKATICTLADVLGLEVYGTSHLIYSAHYEPRGFRDDCGHALIGSSDLRRDVCDAPLELAGERYPRVLDVDALPALPLVADQPWPRRVAAAETARAFLHLVQRGAGAQMPGLLAAPYCEVAIPAVQPSSYHIAQILLDGEFIRVYPDGATMPGVVYPVSDPPALRALVDDLPGVPRTARDEL